MNRIKVKCCKIPKDDRKILGSALIPDLYGNLFVIAPQNSGKTQSLQFTLKKTIDKDTTLIGFVSTHKLDPVYIHLKAWLTRHKINHIFYNDIIDDSGINVLDTLLKQLEDGEDDDQDSAVNEKDGGSMLIGCNCEQRAEADGRRLKRKKYQTPKWVFLFDDIDRGSLRNNDSLGNFCKKVRHFKAKCIISTQNPLDINPRTYNQANWIWLFGGYSDEMIKRLASTKIPTHLSPEEFLAMYKRYTEKKYSFMYIDVKRNLVGMNFDKRQCMK